MTDLPPLDVLLERAHVVAIPMRVRFRGVDVREAVVFEGPAGWGEFAPFPEYGDLESARWLAAGIEEAYAARPAPVRDAVPVNATVPAVPPERVPEVLSRFQGCTTAKVKVAERGQTLRDDLNRLAAVRDAMGPHARIRIDANGAWDVETATEALRRSAAYGIEYAEQPCATVDELAELRAALARNAIDVPIAADESIRKAEDPLLVARRGAADLVVVKVAPLGGIVRALEIVDACGLSPRRSTRASGSPPASRSRLPCRRSSTPVVWAPWDCSCATSPPSRCVPRPACSDRGGSRPIPRRSPPSPHRPSAGNGGWSGWPAATRCSIALECRDDPGLPQR